MIKKADEKKILFISDNRISVGSTRIFIHNTHNYFEELGYYSKINDFEHIPDYDVIILGKGQDYETFLEYKKMNPRALLGTVNPSDINKDYKKILELADFCIVGSLIEKEYYLRYCENVFFVPLIENMFSGYKKHGDKKQIVFAYHGNLDHLTQFNPYLTEALETFSREADIKLRVIYNISTLGPWTAGRPDIPIEECEWSADSIEQNILECDIGLVPGLTPISKKTRQKILPLLNKKEKGYTGFDNDYLIRFKNTTNSGRAFVFYQLGIPVVSDLLPTSFHILGNPGCGYLAHYRDSWLSAFRQLAFSAEKRQAVADRAHREFERQYNRLEWARGLYEEISALSRTGNSKKRKVVMKKMRSEGSTAGKGVVGGKSKKASSSFHTLSADKNLSFFLKPFYVLANNVNNWPKNFNVDTRVADKDFLIQNAGLIWPDLDHLSSPSRLLSDMFWHSLPWQQIEERLGQIGLLDTGCGSGIYYHKLQQYSGSKIVSYNGIDIYEHKKWKEEGSENVHFHVYDGLNISGFLNKKVNFIISQSAIEHFDYDLNYFDQISRFAAASGEPLIQIHHMPAPYCLKLYGYHGIRQYTRRTISKITRLFNDQSRFYLYNLGSKKSADLHYKYITAPIRAGLGDKRFEKKAEYKTKLYDTLVEETTVRTGMPLFYCLVITSNISGELF